MPGFISVHVGAGYHSEKKREQYASLCKNACLKGVEVLRCGGSSVEAVTVATCILEDSYLTNAGRGSNLTWDGTVECDASVMESTGLYGSVGGVSGVQNPVLLAKEICLARSKHLSLDRVPPGLLVGEGAVQWAKAHGLTTVNPAVLITGISISFLETLSDYIRRMDPRILNNGYNTIGYFSDPVDVVSVKEVEANIPSHGCNVASWLIYTNSSSYY